MSIGSRLTDLRIKKGLTRVQLAEELQIPMTTLRNYEQDQREPGHKFLLEASRYFGVTTDYILENEKAPAPEGTGEKEFILLDETNNFLVELGYIQKGQDISDADLAFLEHWFGLLEAWFRRE
jgi:transcriptional regulator with XRE-family HTH domain